MVEISKLKHSGCCDNCLLAVGEKEVYRIVVGCYRLNICKDCFPQFVKEINEQYLKMIEKKG